VAAKQLIKFGANLLTKAKDGKTPITIAEEENHEDVAMELRCYLIQGDLWEPSPDPRLLPSSNRWQEATTVIAASAMTIAYGGGYYYTKRIKIVY